MTDLHAAPDLTPGDLDDTPTGLRRFRGATLDEALAAARLDLGDGLEIVEANRIRRGGLGGFFATDLGIEVIVAGPNSTTSTTSNTQEVTTAVDRLLGRFDLQGGDRFVPSEAEAGPAAAATPTPNLDAVVRDPHPFATQLARELTSNEFTEPDEWDHEHGDSPDLDPTAHVQRTSRFEPAPSRPSTSSDTSTSSGSWDFSGLSDPLVPPIAETGEPSAARPDHGTIGAVTAARPVASRPVQAASSEIASSDSQSSDDALADIDQLLLRAGVSLPVEVASVPPAVTAAVVAAETTPDPISATGSTALALPTSELLLETADRLAEQLAAVEPHVNGTARTLHKLKLKINSPDGGSVEMTAEWSGDE